MKMFGRILTLEQVKDLVKSHSINGEVTLPTEWVLEIIDMAQHKENNEYVEITDKEIPVVPIFEYNCVQMDGITPGGCPVCPACNEPAYEKDRCVFCGQKFKEK